jgi:hypothetical protein
VKEEDEQFVSVMGRCNGLNCNCGCGACGCEEAHS